MTDAALGGLARRIAAARDNLAELRPATAAGEPWPLADGVGPDAESSWGPREVLAHMAEFLPFWLGEFERILAAPADAPAQIGRVPADALRTGLIERDRTLPLNALNDRVDAGSELWLRRLASLDADSLARMGQHATRGPISAGDVADSFVAGHLEEHVVQLRELVPTSG